MKKLDANLIIVSVYVDDVLFTGSNGKLVDEFKVEMFKAFEMIDLGSLTYFLGMVVKQGHDGVFICQKKISKEILKKFHMEDCKVISTPMKKEKFSKEDGTENVDEELYRSLIGCLMYLTTIRPDIMFVVSLLSRFMNCQ